MKANTLVYRVLSAIDRAGVKGMLNKEISDVAGIGADVTTIAATTGDLANRGLVARTKEHVPGRTPHFRSKITERGKLELSTATAAVLATASAKATRNLMVDPPTKHNGAQIAKPRGTPWRKPRHDPIASDVDAAVAAMDHQLAKVRPQPPAGEHPTDREFYSEKTPTGGLLLCWPTWGVSFALTAGEAAIAKAANT
jgi:hypothetical protein